MKSNAKLIMGIVGVVAALIGLWIFFRGDYDGPTPPCPIPAQIAKSGESKLKLAASQFGEIALGEVDLSKKTEVVDLLSDDTDRMLAFGYLMCQATMNKQYDPSDKAQAERVQTINAFLATKPTAEEFIKLQEILIRQKEGPPTARLEIPDLSHDGDKAILALTEPVQTVSLLNAGKAEMSAWVRNESPGRLLVTPRVPATVAALKHAEVEIGLLAPPDSGPWKLKFGSSASEQEMEVEVRVAAAGKLAELLAEVATELQAKAPQAPDSPPSAAGVAPDTAAGAQWLAERTRDVVKRKYPEASDDVVWATTGALLEQMNWNAPAVVAYRASRESLGDGAAELDVPLSRAQVLANIPADPARQEKAPADVLTKEDMDRLGSLQLASRNALVSAKPELARSLSETLATKASLAPFASGLRGDVALVSGTPQAAVAAYDECARTNGAPSCNLRKAEAQVKLKDAAAANATIAGIVAQTPTAAQPVTRSITRRAQQQAATISR